jgi:hypothetical protein
MNHKLQILSDHNIHYTIESYYEIGLTFYLGDRFNGVATFKSFMSFDDGVNWLWNEAKKKFPDNICFINIY